MIMNIATPVKLNILMLAVTLGLLADSVGDRAQWQWTDAPANGLIDIAYGDGKFVVVGISTIMTSNDGLTWDARIVPPGGDFRNIAHGPPGFVVTGTNDFRDLLPSDILLFSADGSTWEHIGGDYFGLGSIGKVSWLGDRFLVLPNDRSRPSGTTTPYLTSRDGRNWDEHTIDMQGDWPASFPDPAYGNGLYVVAGESNAFVSDDGITWRAHPIVDNRRSGVASIRFASGKFEAFAGHRVFTSTDGEHWEEEPLPEFLQLEHVVEGNGITVGYSEGFDTVGIRDGSGIWIRHERKPRIAPVAYGSGKFVGVTSAATVASSTVAISTDGIDWTTREPKISAQFTHLVAGAAGIVVFAWENRLFHSTDFLTWTEHVAPFRVASSTAYADGRYLAFGGGHLWVSTDGINWIQEEERFKVRPNIFTYGNGKWMGVQWSGSRRFGALGRSVGDHKSWERINLSKEPLYASGVAFGQGTFVIAGTGIWTTTSGSSLRLRDLNHHNWNSIIFDGSQFVTLGINGSGDLFTATSHEGTKWEERAHDIEIGSEIRQAAHGQGLYVGTTARTSRNHLIVSTDLENWSIVGFTDRDPIAVEFHRDRFIALTEDSILVSIPRKEGVYQNWKDSVFDTDELNDISISGDLADVDFDSLGTLAEFALGGDPKVAEPHLLPKIQRESESLRLSFSRPSAFAGDLDYRLQSSDSSLEDWEDITLPSDAITIHPNENGTESVYWNLSSIEPDQSVYFRIKISRAELNQ